MIRLRRSNDRGQTKIGWLDSRHTFSFGDYHDPQHMGFRDLESSMKTGLSRQRLSDALASRHGNRHLRARRRLGA